MCRHVVITETRKSERVVHHDREDYGQGSVLLLSQLPHRSFSEWNGHAFDDIAIRVTGQWQFMVHQRHMVHLTQISGMLSLGRESTAFQAVQAVHNPRTAGYVA